MSSTSIQDRTAEFNSILTQAQRRQVGSRVGAQRQSLLTATEKRDANGSTSIPKQRSAFARDAAELSRRITGVMARLQRLAELTRKKSLFNDQTPEINGLTEVIKRDLEAMRTDLGRLSTQSKAAHPKAWEKRHFGPSDQDQVGEHEKSVFGLFTEQVANAALHLEQISEVRMQNARESKERQNRFLSTVSSHSQIPVDHTRSDSPLYQTPVRGRSPRPGMSAVQQDLLSLEPSSSSSALVRNGGPQTDLQLQLMEEGSQSNTYIQQRGEAIDTIQRTMDELGKIFGQLAQMVAEQGEEIQRIDANTEDVVENVQGAQRELMKYWNRVSGNRWLIAKMFGVLMIFFLLWVLIAG